MAKKKEKLSLEELLEQALVKEEDRPYEVPENWVWTRLEVVLSEIKNGTTIPQNKERLGAMVTRIESIQNNRIDFNRIGYIADTTKIKEKDWYSANDIALSHINSAEHVGKTAIITEELLPLVHGMNLLRLRFNSACNAYYFYYFTQSFEYKQSIFNRINMAVNQVSINQKKVKDIPMPLPPIAEQQRIVDIIESLFEKLDTAKEMIQNALDSFENRKAAILHKAFTGELTTKWREENGVSLEEWNKSTAREVCEFITKGETPTKSISNKGEIPFLKVYNIRNNKLDFNYNPAYIPKEIHDNRMKRSKVFPNDIIMNIVGPPLQKVAIVTDEFNEWNINQAIAIFRVKEKIITKYLYYCLLCDDTLASVLVDVRGVVGQSNISLKQCRNLVIPLPSIVEQKEIVRILDNLLDNEECANELCDVIEK